jgi:hypothetical protein
MGGSRGVQGVRTTFRPKVPFSGPKRRVQFSMFIPLLLETPKKALGHCTKPKIYPEKALVHCTNPEKKFIATIGKMWNLIPQMPGKRILALEFSIFSETPLAKTKWGPRLRRVSPLFTEVAPPPPPVCANQL